MIDPRSAEGARLAAAEVAARAEIKRCLALVEDRTNPAEPATQAWTDAIARWGAVLDRLYPEEFQAALAALKQTRHREPGARQWVWSKAPAASIETGIRFLEADLLFFRSGYVKEQCLRRLARQPLGEDEKRRLKGVVLAVLLRPTRREFRAACRLAASVGDDDLMTRVMEVANGADPQMARRAGWMSDAISRGFRERRRQSAS